MPIPRQVIQPSPNRPEVWGGIECTVNRVGNRYFDQIERSGHAARPDDFELFAALGLRTLRYPVLWERVAPGALDAADWTWVDERMSRMQQHGITPIVGFVHHGSGPRHTSLLDPEFPQRLAAFALAFARRYPHVDRYTPVNEPLTTARFSALYGHWYPHATSDDAFVRALTIQCRAVVLAMRAIRTINPDAQLVQTEDIGRVFSTPTLSYQAQFENERRWLTFDLLSGREPGGVAATYLRRMRNARQAIEWLLDNPLPPDIIGMNYYVTSERFLDHRIDAYPEHLRGGNGRHRYADVEAARVFSRGLHGAFNILRETWQRYHVPVAITEAHLGGHRDDQLRWLRDVWEDVCDARVAGVDVRAMTVWSLLGAFDWHNLLTRIDGHYESGAFDVRSAMPRPTAVATLVRELVRGEEPSHPVLCSEGWWRRNDRFAHPVYPHSALTDVCGRRPRSAPRPVLITGGTGTLGRAFARVCQSRGIEHRLVTRSELDIADSRSVSRMLEECRPWAVINAAGYVRVDDAETDIARCWRANADGPVTLATECAKRRVALVTFSSDLVFDGSQSAPYLETDSVAPLNAYGRSKADAERRVQAVMPNALIVRTSAFFGPWDEHNVVVRALDALAAGIPFQVASDATVSPTFVPDLVHTTLDLLIDGESGVWHLANDGAVSWFEFVRKAATLADLNTDLLDGRPLDELLLPAPRPRYSALSSRRAQLLPGLDDALMRFVEQRAAAGMQVA